MCRTPCSLSTCAAAQERPEEGELLQMAPLPTTLNLATALCANLGEPRETTAIRHAAVANSVECNGEPTKAKHTCSACRRGTHMCSQARPCRIIMRCKTGDQWAIVRILPPCVPAHLASSARVRSVSASMRGRGPLQIIYMLHFIVRDSSSMSFLSVLHGESDYLSCVSQLRRVMSLGQFVAANFCD